MYKSDYDQLRDDEIKDIFNHTHIRSSFGRKVVKIGLDGSFVSEGTAIELVDDVDRSSLYKACAGKYSKSGHLFKDYLWFNKSDYDKMSSDDVKRIAREVNEKVNDLKAKSEFVKISVDENVVMEYNNFHHFDLKEFSVGCMQKACKGKFKGEYGGHKYKDYIWYYKLDYEEMIKNNMGQAG